MPLSLVVSTEKPKLAEIENKCKTKTKYGSFLA